MQFINLSLKYVKIYIYKYFSFKNLWIAFDKGNMFNFLSKYSQNLQKHFTTSENSVNCYTGAVDSFILIF